MTGLDWDQLKVVSETGFPAGPGHNVEEPTMRYVYLVTLAEPHPATAKFKFFNFECGKASLGELTDALNRGDIVAGENLITRRSLEFGVVEVLHRQPFALRLAAIASVEMPRVRFVEHEAAE